MLHESPLRNCHDRYAAMLASRSPDETLTVQRPGAARGERVASSGVEWLTYGPADAAGLVQCEVVATFGEVEAEYAAIRRGAGLFDGAHRGTIRITGTERVAFLNRMLTQQLEHLDAGIAAESFWLNRKGRIEADLLLSGREEELIVDVDVHQAASTVASLDDYVFAEDIEITDVSGAFHHLTVHGPQALAVLAAASRMEALAIDPMRCTTLVIAGVETLVTRRDPVGEVSLDLAVPLDHAETVWEALLATDATIGDGKRRVRPIGWHAFNIARIEAGTPLFNIDYGTNNLPHETGILHDRVDFTKGCYLGQEVVARMESLGRPKQILVGLKVVDERLPVAGAQVFDRTDGGMGDQIGVVTSSTPSPMLGAQPIAFAMVKSAKAKDGTTVLVNAEGGQAEAVVGPLRMYGNQSEA
jgi:folate-binding protein YgfZ